MAERPIILFPKPQLADRDKRKMPIPQVNKPSFGKQYRRLQPTFVVLEEAFKKKNMQIQNTPTGINPEFALVFEVVGTVESFYTAVKNSEGLEWIFDKESFDIEPDEDFYYAKDRDKNISGKVYCVMTNQEAMKQMILCWERFNAGEIDVFKRGYAGLRDIFVNIKKIRKWTSKDRIQESRVIDYWKESLEIEGHIAIPFEVELFYRKDSVNRSLAECAVTREIEKLGGQVLNKCHIAEIAYHALLVELPRNEIEKLIHNHEQVQLVHIDDVMFFRPICQSVFNVYDEDDTLVEEIDKNILVDKVMPIMGVFDGMPIQNHPLLKDRIILDDPDGYEIGYESRHRCHGTAMSSLILNGDLNKKEFLNHRIYLRPILKPREAVPNTYVEEVPRDCLIVDKIHVSVVRLFETQNGINPVAPTVRVINLSLGDPARQLTTLMSPLARLIDYLSFKYSILFIVSAGNHPETISMMGSSFDELRRKNISERSEEYFKCLSNNQRNIKVLSPAENINGLTIGAIYDDYCEVDENERAIFAVQRGLPSPISSYGKGYRSIITPDLYYRGGRKFIVDSLNGKCKWLQSSHEPGCKVAAPTKDSQKGQAFTFGTSDATALISHEALKCYDILNDIYKLETGEEPPYNYIAILVKAMLTHGASWGDIASQVAKMTEAKEKQVSRWLGYGIPNISRVEECTKNRITLIGSGSLKKDEGHIFTLPLPVDISSKIIKRRLIVTLAYFSPVEVSKQAYRTAKLWFDVVGNEQLASIRENTEWQAVQKGTLQHEIFESEKALIWDDKKEIQIKVNCKEDAGKFKNDIPYCIFVTFEVAEGYNIDIYSKVVNKVKTAIKP